MIKVKCIFSRASPEDGKRYLVDLFWPEGLFTRTAQVHHWYRQLGPSYDLQRFEFDVANWEHYKRKYSEEISCNPDKKQILEEIAAEAEGSTVTLLYGNKDDTHNHALILKEIIDEAHERNDE